MNEFAPSVRFRRTRRSSPALRVVLWICRLSLLFLALALWVGGGAALQAQQPSSLVYLHAFGFTTNDGSEPYLPVILGQGNVLYGSTRVGGTNIYGSLFKLNIDGTGYTELYAFNGQQSASYQPFSGPGGTPLVQGADGGLYGIIFGGTTNNNGFAFRLNPDGTDFQVLHGFGNGDSGPLNLMQGADGFLYGGTYLSIFKLSTNGSSYSDPRQLTNSGDSLELFGTFIHDAHGTLYGTGYFGGTNGFGTVFKINTDGSDYEILHTFLTDGVDGQSPWAGLVQGSDGALYGTTIAGGTNNAGTVFELNPDGSGYQVLHHFLTNGVDGQQPFGTLVRGLDNKLYGTTQAGGANRGGTVFEMGLGGSNYTVLYTFGSPALTNAHPLAGLVQGPASGGSGVLYGTTYSESGTVFAITVNPPLTITPAVSSTESAGSTGPIISWPSWALGYVLQTTTNPASGNWVPVTNGLPMTGMQLTNTTAPNAYFRLSLQP